MTAPPLFGVVDAVHAHGQAVRITIVRAEGSTPQGVGAAITATQEGFEGTIGGGALEHQALQVAKGMLGASPAEAAAWRRRLEDWPLGPSLGQCCGGRVTLLFEAFGPAEARALAALEGEAVQRPFVAGAPIRAAAPGDDALDDDDPDDDAKNAYAEPDRRTASPLFLYGAGHVGRAVVRAFAGLPFELYWLDVDAARFPDQSPNGVHRMPTKEMARAAMVAPADAWHVVMTYAHDLDLEICHAVLERNAFAYLGLIASATKRARFERRLATLGVEPARIARLHAPIGLPGVEAKSPATIAASLAGDLLMRRAADG